MEGLGEEKEAVFVEHELQALIRSGELVPVLRKFDSLDPGRKALIVSNLSAVCVELGERGQSFFKQFLDRFANLSGSLLEGFFGQLEKLLGHLAESDWGQEIMLARMPGLFIELLVNRGLGMASLVVEGLSQIADVSSPQQIQDYLLARVLELAHSRQGNEKVASLLLFNRMAARFGAESCRSIIAS
jgi:hypothetical protein